MRKREATDTIIGYFYQFDYSIKRILELQNLNDTIIIEGIEDVDINTTDEYLAIQCKYYEKTEYNHSIIAEPIRLMLSHFKEVKEGKKRSVHYYLYGHYKSGQQKLEQPITKDFLKKHFLTYTKEKIKRYHHLELKLTDDDLEEFLKKLSINIYAVKYEDQLEEIIDILQNQFKCTRFQAEHYYYNNALKFIKEIAVKKNSSERKISKREFIQGIDKKQYLFNEWFIALKGKKNYLNYLRKEYFSSLNISPFERFFLIEIDQRKYLRSELKELLFIISKKWSKLSNKTPKTFCPYVYLHNLPEEELIEIKTELYKEGFKINDGFVFAGATFSPKAICEPATPGNEIKLKIINNVNYIDLIIDEINNTKEIYQFYIFQPFYNLDNPGIKHIKFQIQEIKDIKEVI